MSFVDSPRVDRDYLGNSDTLHYRYAWANTGGIESLVHNQLGKPESARGAMLPGGTIEIIYTIVGAGGGSTTVTDTIDVEAPGAAAVKEALDGLNANIADRPATESLALINMLAASGSASDEESKESDNNKGVATEPTAEELAAQDDQRQQLMGALSSVLDMLSGSVDVVTGIESIMLVSIDSGTVLDVATSKFFCGEFRRWNASAFDSLKASALLAYYTAIQEVADFPPLADNVETIAKYVSVVIQYEAEGGQALFADVNEKLCGLDSDNAQARQRRDTSASLTLRLVLSATAVDADFTGETATQANDALISNDIVIGAFQAALERFDAVDVSSGRNATILVQYDGTAAIESTQAVTISADQADAMVSGVTNVLGGEEPPTAMSADSAFQAADLLSKLSGSGVVSVDGAKKVGQAVSNIFSSTSALSADDTEDLVGSVLSSMTNVNVNLAKGLEEGAPPIQTASADGSFKSASGKAFCDIEGTTHIECGAVTYDIPNTWLFKKVSDSSGSGSGSDTDDGVYECENVFTSLGFKDNPHTWAIGSDGLSSTGSLDLFSAGGSSASRSGLADCATINIDTSAGLEATAETVGAVELAVNQTSSHTFSVTKNPLEDANRTFHVVVEPLQTIDGAPSKITVSLNADYLEVPVERELMSVRSSVDWSTSSIIDSSFVFRIIPERLSYAVCSGDTAIADAGGVNTDGQFNITVTTDEAINVDLIVYIFDSECLFLDEDTNTWSDRDCVPSGMTTTGMLKCKCNHLTNFGGKSGPRGVLVPNFVDFGKAITAEDIADNPIIFATIVIIWIGFVLLMIKAYREDCRNQLAVGPVSVASNSGLHLGAYRVTVKTGIRPNAGLGHESRVFIRMVGSRGTSSWIELGHPWRPLFLRNATDVFRVTTPLNIGVIKSITIKHDNNGYDPRWFVSHVEVVNLVRGLSSERFFWVSEWLADDMDNSSLQHTAKGETAEEATFSQTFQEHLFYKIADQHTFASVFLAAPSSTFSKLERTMCCMVFFTGTVMSNAMFYPVDGTVPPISDMIQKSVYSVAIVTTITTMIVYLFRHSRLRRPLDNQGSIIASSLAFVTAVATGPVLDGIAKSKRAAALAKSSTSKSSTLKRPRRKSSLLIKRKSSTRKTGPRKNATMGKGAALASLAMDHRAQEELNDMEDILANMNHRRDDYEDNGVDSLTLPWWCGPLAWVLSFAGIISASIYILQFSFEYGSQVSRRWLGSFLVSLMTMMLFSDPLIIMLVVLVFMLLFTNKVGASTSTDTNMTTGKEIVTANAAIVEDLQKQRITKAKETSHVPISKVDENVKRRRQRINNETWQILKDTVGHFLFYGVLSVVMYNQKDDRVFTMLGGVRSLVHVMTDDDFAAPSMMAGSFLPGSNTLGTPSGDGYNAISSKEEFWDWAANALPPLFEKDDDGRLIYGGGELHLVGGVRIRQLRVNEGACVVPSRITAWLPNDMCNARWRDVDSNKNDMLNSIKTNLEVPRNRQYDDSGECPSYKGYFDGNDYVGCGYIQDFTNSTSDFVSGMLKTLRNERWLDSLSRLVQVEFTVYNPALDHAVTAALGVEFPPTGGAISSGGFRTHKVNRYPYADAWGYVLCEFIVLFTTLYLCYRSLLNYKQMNATRESCRAAEQVHMKAISNGHRVTQSSEDVPYDFELDDLSVSFGGPAEWDILIALPALDDETYDVDKNTLHAAVSTVLKQCELKGIDGEPRPETKVEGGWPDVEPTNVRVSNLLRSPKRAEQERLVASKQGLSDAILAEYYKQQQHNLVWILRLGNALDVLLIIFILIMIGLNGARWLKMRNTLKEYTEQIAGANPNKYFGAFQEFRPVDDAVEFVNGCCMFIGLMKFCGLLRHNTKVKRCIALLDLTGSTILSSLFLVIGVLAVYSTTGHLLLGSGRPAFATWMGSCSELFSTLVGKVSYETILSSDGNEAVNPFITQMFFMSYAFINVFIAINLFIGILNDAVNVCREIPESEHDIFLYFWRSVKRALGISTKQQAKKVAKDVCTSTLAVAVALDDLEKQFVAFEDRSSAFLIQMDAEDKRAQPRPSAGEKLLSAFREERKSVAKPLDASPEPLDASPELEPGASAEKVEITQEQDAGGQETKVPTPTLPSGSVDAAPPPPASMPAFVNGKSPQESGDNVLDDLFGKLPKTRPSGSNDNRPGQRPRPRDSTGKVHVFKF